MAAWSPCNMRCRGRPCEEVKALLSRVFGIIVAILIIVWIVSNPAGAGDSVHGWVAGIFTFFRHLS